MMTEKEAKEVLRLNGYCTVHGVELKYQPANFYGRGFEYCPKCTEERENQARQQIIEAKKVLGIA